MKYSSKVFLLPRYYYLPFSNVLSSEEYTYVYAGSTLINMRVPFSNDISGIISDIVGALKNILFH